MSEIVQSSTFSESFCLLEWIHTFPNSHTIICLSDLSHSSFILQILKDLDLDLYKSTSADKLQGIDLAFQLSRYLLKHITTRILITRDYRIQQLVSKLLYVCVHSGKKQQFIQKILSLDDQIQGVLMRLIEKIENEIIVIKENRLILDKIADLQTANEQLIIQHSQEKISHQKLNNLLDATKVELKQLEEECAKYRKEKAETLRELQIDELSNYVSVYRKIQRQNSQYLSSIKDLESKIYKFEEDNKQLKQKIIQDGMIISKYEQDSKQMRSNLKKLRSFKKKSQFFPEDDSFLDDKSPGHSYCYIVKQLQNHISSQKQKYTKQILQYDNKMVSLVKQNGQLRKMTKYLSRQIGQLQKVYKEVREQITV